MAHHQQPGVELMTPPLSPDASEVEEGLAPITPPGSSTAPPSSSSSSSDEAGEGGDLPHAWKVLWGVDMLLVVGVGGLVTAASVATLSALAANCGRTATDLGSVYISRGVGSIAGAFLGGPLCERVRAPTLIGVVLLLLTGSLAWTPFVRQARWLHLVSLLGGLATSLSDVGCQVILKTVHGDGAGPWLGLQCLSFGVFCTLVPLTASLSGDDPVAVYVLLASLCLALGLSTLILHAAHLLCLATPPHTPTRGGSALLAGPCWWEHWHPRRYKREVLLGAIMFGVVGSNDAVVAYMPSYLAAHPKAAHPSQASSVVLCVYVAIALSRGLGVLDQRVAGVQALYRHTAACLLLSAAGGLLLSLWPDSSVALWCGVVAYSLFSGPTVGFCFDLNHRVTRFSELGTALPLLLLHVGGALVPFTVSQAWVRGGGAATLPASLTATSLAGLVALQLSRAVENDYRDTSKA